MRIITAFSRDPCGLFVEAGGMLHGAAKLQQPVAYKRATMRLASQEAVVSYETRVNWHTGDIVCYTDADDAMNNVPFLQTNRKIAMPAPRQRDEYVRETFAFLSRGHSMLVPECKCRYGLTSERSRELGIAWGEDGAADVCLVPRNKGRRSFEEIALELNVDSLHGVFEDGGMSLLRVLVQLAGMVVTGGHYLHSPMCCIPPFIRTVSDVAHAARILAPLPYSIVVEKAKQMLPLLRQNKELLIMEDCHALKDSESSYCYQIFWQAPALVSVVSDDIKAMWHETKCEKQGLEQALVAAGLCPTLMRSAPVAKKTASKRSSKKRDATGLTQAQTKKRSMTLPTRR